MSDYSHIFRACALALVPVMAAIPAEAASLKDRGFFEKGSWAGGCSVDKSGRSECRALSNLFYSDAISERPLRAYSLQLGFDGQSVPQAIHFNVQDYEGYSFEPKNPPEVIILIRSEEGVKEVKLNLARCERSTDCRYEAPLTPEILQDIYAARSLKVIYLYKEDGKLRGSGQMIFNPESVKDVVEYMNQDY